MHYGRLYSKTSHYTSWNISPTTRQWHNQCNIYRWNTPSSRQDCIIQWHGDTRRPKYPGQWPIQHGVIHIQWHHACFWLQKHVTSPTHKCSHTLDLIFSNMNSELNLHKCTVHEIISDHTLVTIDTTLNKAPWEPTEKAIRDITKLSKTILEKYYTTPVTENNASLEQASDQFNEELHKMLNRAAPQKKVRYANRQKKTWYKCICEQKRIVKHRDHIYKNTKETTTGEHTPLKETGTTGCWNTTKNN